MVPSFEKRVRAFAIDTSGVALAGILAIGVSPQSETLSYVIFLGAAFFFYLFPYFRNTGQTLGKRVQKIQVVLKDGSKAPIWLLLLRDTTKILASVFSAGIYLMVCMFFMNSHTSRTIHDYLFQTKMIDLEKRQGKDDILGRSSLLKDRGL
jgi:uncharacterized RDD family membrane protein YckC